MNFCILYEESILEIFFLGFEMNDEQNDSFHRDEHQQLLLRQFVQPTNLFDSILRYCQNSRRNQNSISTDEEEKKSEMNDRLTFIELVFVVLFVSPLTLISKRLNRRGFSKEIESVFRPIKLDRRVFWG